MNVVELKHQRQNIYLACENLDFVWDERDVVAFDHMWNEGFSIWDIAKAFDRDPDEVVILAIDRVKRGNIQKRKGGVWGRRMPR
jgi:hypothetical protein